jgi:hypothetical protein
MEFWASSETDQPAGSAVERIRRCVEPFLNAAFAASSLATLGCKLRYVPIVMPEGTRERYPARSKLRKKERIYDCAPRLAYGVFVEGRFEDQLWEYLRGVGLAASHLAGLGASLQQINEFEAIMASAAERILAERPDQTRH